MIHPLNDALERCNYANQKFLELKERISNYPADQQSVKFRQEFNSADNTITIYVSNQIEYPIEWALAMSEIIHNCRVALDYVAWELRNLHQERIGNFSKEDSLTSFIIESSEKKFRESKKLSLLDPSHISILEKFQPFGSVCIEEGREAVRYLYENKAESEIDWNLIDDVVKARNPLTILATLENVDKHKILKRVVNSAKASHLNDYVAIDCELQSRNNFILLEIEEGAKWAECVVTPTGPNPRFEITDVIRTEVSFGGHSLTVVEPIIGSIQRIIFECSALFS